MDLIRKIGSTLGLNYKYFYEFREDIYKFIKMNMEQNNGYPAYCEIKFKPLFIGEYEITIEAYYRIQSKDRYIKKKASLQCRDIRYIPSNIKEMLDDEGSAKIIVEDIEELMQDDNFDVENPITFKGLCESLNTKKKSNEKYKNSKSFIQIEDRLFYKDVFLIFEFKDNNDKYGIRYADILQLPKDIVERLSESIEPVKLRID